MTGTRGAAPSPSDARPVWAEVDRVLEVGLAATKHEKGKETLRHVHEAVRALRAANVRITVEAVSRWRPAATEEPEPQVIRTAQVIRNSERAMAIVRVAMGVQAAESMPRTPGRPLEVEVLEQVGNRDLRTRLEGWLEERRTWRHEADELRKALRSLTAITAMPPELAALGPDKLEERAAQIKATMREAGHPEFDDGERKACRAFLEDGIAAAGLTLDAESGVVIDRVSRTVLPRGVVSAIRKVAAAPPP